MGTFSKGFLLVFILTMTYFELSDVFVIFSGQTGIENTHTYNKKYKLQYKTEKLSFGITILFEHITHSKTNTKLKWCFLHFP